MNQQASTLPDNVPEHLVQPFDYINGKGMNTDPFLAVAELHNGPDIFWNPINIRHDGRGTWDITKASHMREILGNPDVFSSAYIAGFSKLVGEDWLLTPLEVDPPKHEFFRSFLNPLFSPVAIKKLDGRINERVQELLNNIKTQGGCEFMEAFGRPFPVTIIMELLGLPREELPLFLGWAYSLLHDPSIKVKSQTAMSIRDYLKARIAEKKKNPADDFFSYVVNEKANGRLLSDDESLGICYLMFVGGLDTVASSLGFHYHYLANHHDKQQELRDNPKIIPHAVEELLRRFSVVMPARHVTQDIEFHGVHMKKGDWISIPQALSSTDPTEFENPLAVNFNRRSRHLAFSFGPHFCMGSHIAKRELVAALQQWTTQLPVFSIKPNSKFEVHGGGVFGIEHLELQW